jgi:hypothetical protein
MNNPCPQNNFFAPVLTCILSIVGLSIIWLGFQTYNVEQRYRAFVPAEAVITSSETRLHQTGYGRNRSSQWITHVEFEYSGSDDETHTASTKIADNWMHPEWGNGSTWDEGQWRAGRSFTVYVNPMNSKDWSLNQGPSRETWLTLAFGGTLALVNALLFYPTLFKLFSSDPGEAYLPPDDPRMLNRDTYDRDRYY